MTTVVPEGIRQLLEQRSTYREWLSRLDDVGSAFRSDVADRVRHDYEDRLEGVAKELEGHRHEIESSLEGRRSRLEELTSGFDRRSTELEEAKLRYEVGEFDEETWDERRETLTEGLAGIESDLGEARAAVEELQRVLGELSEAALGRPALVVDEGLHLEADSAHEDVGEPMREAEVEQESPIEPEAAIEPEAVSAEPEPVQREARESVRARSMEDAPAGSDDYADELEFLESLSLDDPDSFDAVSRMLEDEEDR